MFGVSGGAGSYRTWEDTLRNHKILALEKWCFDLQRLSHAQLFVTPWTAAHQASLFMEFSRQEYCSGLPFLSPGDLPHPAIILRSPVLQTNSLPSEPPGKPLHSTEGTLKYLMAAWSQAFIVVFNY